jgi:hypothetical protein
MTSLFKLIQQSHDQHNNIDHHSTKYVEPVETSNGEKEVSEVG